MDLKRPCPKAVVPGSAHLVDSSDIVIHMGSICARLGGQRGFGFHARICHLDKQNSPDELPVCLKLEKSLNVPERPERPERLNS